MRDAKCSLANLLFMCEPAAEQTPKSVQPEKKLTLSNVVGSGSMSSLKLPLPNDHGNDRIGALRCARRPRVTPTTQVVVVDLQVLWLSRDRFAQKGFGTRRFLSRAAEQMSMRRVSRAGMLGLQLDCRGPHVRSVAAKIP